MGTRNGYVGGVRRITIKCFNAARVLTDPTSLTVDVIPAGGAEVPCTWPAVSTPPITRDPGFVAGVFRLDWPMAVEGTHTYKVAAAGAVTDATSGLFVVVDTPHD